jgi:hypothetical protein
MHNIGGGARLTAIGMHKFLVAWNIPVAAGTALLHALHRKQCQIDFATLPKGFENADEGNDIIRKGSNNFITFTSL